MNTIKNLAKWSNWYIALGTNSDLTPDQRYQILHKIVKHCVLIEQALLDQGWTNLQINQEILNEYRKKV